ncbi:MAG: hypothetical protein KDD75_15320, partial [Caldilineaceae bacterium]|nr:hypothetical protein [Caldilineaceae bacterium]
SWRIDVLDSSGNVLGPGPITSAAGWESTARMDRAGTFSFEMPASDSKSSLVEPLRIVRCYALVGGAWTEVGAGVVERIETQIGDDGGVTLRVSGSDMLALLSNFSPIQYYLDGSTVLPVGAVTHAQAVSGLEPNDWTFVPDAAPPVNDLTGRWNYETTLQACVSLAAKCQTHFYLSGFREVTFASATADSGIRATKAASGGPVAAISGVRKIEDGADIVTEIIPFGAGNADARLTMISHTRTVPTGFTTFVTPNGWWMSLSEDAPYSQYGPRRRVVQWTDISPISSTDGDIEAAANMLFDQAYRYLVQHNRPAEFYDLSLIECPAILRPLQTIRVVYRDVAQNVNIDADLLILEVTTEVQADGPRVTGLVVSTVDRWPESDAGAVVQRLVQSQLYEAAPQLNANSYVISYTKPVDDAETANFRFRFDSEVVQLTRLTFDFQLLPLESTVKSVAGTEVTTPAGGGSTTPSGGGSTTVSGGGSTTVSGGGSTTPSGGGGTTPSGGGTTTDSGSGHTHELNLANSTSGTAVYFAGTGSPPTGDFRTSGGGKVNTSSTGSGHTHSVPDHTHSTPNHVHDTPNHTHATPNHQHATPDHTHSTPNHTHTFTPTITAAYGIFRDSAGNTFGLTDLEYSVDGSTWYAFTVGVNGFASLGDGWYRVDLTSLLQNSTTLRPTANNNAVQVRRKAAGAIKKAMIEAQINVRTIIQAIAAL